MMPAKPRRAKILPRNCPKAASATAPMAHTSEAIKRTREGAGKSKYSAPAAQAMNGAATKLPKAIKTKRTTLETKRLFGFQLFSIVAIVTNQGLTLRAHISNYFRLTRRPKTGIESISGLQCRFSQRLDEVSHWLACEVM